MVIATARWEMLQRVELAGSAGRNHLDIQVMGVFRQAKDVPLRRAVYHWGDWMQAGFERAANYDNT